MQKGFPFPFLRAPSLAHYALSFFIVLALILLAIVWATLKQTSAVKQSIIESNHKAALRELSLANTEIIQIAKDAARSLSNWDEVRQQLAQPVYYAYWRTSRAFNAGKLSPVIEGMDLYDKKLVILSPSPSGEGTMPAQIPGDFAGSIFLVKEEGHDHLYYFFPVHADENPATPLIGWGGIKLDYSQTMQTLRPLRYIRTNGISIVADEKEILRPADIVPHVKFDLAPTPELDAIEQIMTNALYRIAWIFGLFSVFAYLMTVSLLERPLRRLARHIDAMREDRGTLLSKSYRGLLPVSELEQLRLSFNDYQTRLDDMHLSLEDKNKELWTLAHHDPLTGIPNRRAFEEDWTRLLARVSGQPEEICFLLFDCDHFKAINDSYGHHVGDLVIQGIAESIHTALRSEDRLYRLGGDEFVTLLHDTSLENARIVGERCIAEVNNYDFASHGVKEPIRISIGLAHVVGTDADGLATLHKQADLAMYHAKKPGHAKLAVYSDTMATNIRSIVSSSETNAVYEAIATGKLLEMHYQKVVALSSRTPAYYEALVRIRRGDVLIMPSSIFPVVEARRLEVEFDLAVIKAIHGDLADGLIPEGSGVSVNVSGPSIVNATVTAKLLELVPFMPAYKLVIEVTETALITQINHASTNLNRLRKAGFIIALDDFGSGYSSLRYLSSMPVDLVKFDITMVRALEDRDRQSAIVENLANLVNAAGYKIVAEGIETEETLKKVTELGFSHAQGYYLGRPGRF